MVVSFDGLGMEGTRQACLLVIADTWQCMAHMGWFDTCQTCLLVSADTWVCTMHVKNMVRPLRLYNFM